MDSKAQIVHISFVFCSCIQCMTALIVNAIHSVLLQVCIWNDITCQENSFHKFNEVEITTANFQITSRHGFSPLHSGDTHDVVHLGARYTTWANISKSTKGTPFPKSMGFSGTINKNPARYGNGMGSLPQGGSLIGEPPSLNSPACHL